MKRLISCTIILALAYISSAQREVFESYAERYSPIAISEMHRTGIPASIKLAQGLLESNAGRSELAKKANNHFGIKCGGDWNGKTYHKEDDDYRNGRLVKSCFRVFKNDEESYVAHSEFLRNPSKYSRYNFLFSYASTDYKSWAHGLKKAGYATAPTYAQRLIKLIEDYELYKYDQEVEHIPDLPVVADLGSKGRSMKKTMLTRASTFKNGVRLVYAMAGEDVETLAERHKVSPERIIKYNEHLEDEDDQLNYGDLVYLSRKRSRYRGKMKTYKVKSGENLIDIAQQFGVRLKSLRRKNRLEKGEEPKVGEVIYLKSRRKRSDVIEVRRTEKDDIHIDDSEPINNTPYTVLDTENDKSISPVDTEDKRKMDPKINANTQYTVVAGDTLYSISRRFNISIYDLKMSNALEGDTIAIGQLLIIP